MGSIKKKSLSLALAAGLGVSSLAMAQQAGGVHVNPDGTGQVLLYPYYTTRGGMDTYLSLVNTKNEVKAVKVRFIEGKNSREVLDFNLYLSPYDMWTAAVVDDGTGAKMVTVDKSCTTPPIPSAGVAFMDRAYVGKVTTSTALAEGINLNGTDGESTSLDRTREGYIEIIEMGVVNRGGGDKDDYPAKTYLGVIHANGVPKDCSVVQNLPAGSELPGGPDDPHLSIGAPTGGLTGSASLIAPAYGTDFSFDPVALNNFANEEIWHTAGTIEPDLRHGISQSVVFYDQEVVLSQWSGTSGYGLLGEPNLDSVNAVNATLMHESVINEFVLDSTTLSGTDWVVTMPTKRYHVPVWDGKNPVSQPEVYPPFTTTFWKDGACEPVSIYNWDREERVNVVEGFSPPPHTDNALCWEANVITFNDSNILSSANSVNINVGNFQNGWLAIALEGDGHVLHSASGDTYHGLPVIGFMVQDFLNKNAAPGVMASYGGSFIHKYETRIETTGCAPGKVYLDGAEGDGCIPEGDCATSGLYGGHIVDRTCVLNDAPPFQCSPGTYLLLGGIDQTDCVTAEACAIAGGDDYPYGGVASGGVCIPKDSSGTVINGAYCGNKALFPGNWVYLPGTPGQCIEMDDCKKSDKNPGGFAGTVDDTNTCVPKVK